MFRKFYPLALSSMLCISSLAAQVSIAGAAAIPTLPQSMVSDMAYGNNALLLDVQDRRAGNNMGWDGNRFDNRCNDRSGNCRSHRNDHYNRNGHYNQNPGVLLPLVIGGAIASSNYYNNYNDDDDGSWSNSHVRWCLNRYRSYNPRNNLWLSNSGQYRQCNGPS